MHEREKSFQLKSKLSFVEHKGKADDSLNARVETILWESFTECFQPESLPVLREEVEEVVHSLKAGKSPGVDNIAS